MDPVTAIQVASAAITGAKDAFKLGKAIFEFVQDARQIDNTARDFASEIDALGSACNAVANMVEGIVQEHTKNQHLQANSFAPSAPLLGCLERQIITCHDTVCQLNVAVSCIEPYRAHSSSFMDQAWRQIKLNMKARNIDEVRNRIRSHTSSLQLTLQSLSVAVSYVIPNRVDQLLRGRLDELADSQMKLLSLQEQRFGDSGEKVQQDDEAYILQASEKIKLSGESIYSTSQAGGSVMGDSLLGKTSYISSWMEDIDAIDRVTSASSTDLTSVSSIFSNSRPDGGAGLEDTVSMSSPHDPEMAQSEGDMSDEAESDDELALAATDMCIAQGKAAFNEKDFSQADTFLKEALRMVRELPSVRQNICDVDHLRFMLGVCSFHLEQPSVAKEALLRVVNGMHRAKKQDKARLIPILEAGHLLAQVYLKLGELEQARSTCDSTLNARGRVLGRTHESYYQSLALKVRMYELEGNFNRAIVYAKLLPDEHRDSLMQTVQQLQLGDRAVKGVKPDSNSTLGASPPPPSDAKSKNSAHTHVEAEPTSGNAGKAHVDTQDVKQRQADRAKLMAAAEKRVHDRMHNMDEKIFVETGKASQSLMDEWEVKAREEADRAGREAEQRKSPSSDAKPQMFTSSLPTPRPSTNVSLLDAHISILLAPNIYSSPDVSTYLTTDIVIKVQPDSFSFSGWKIIRRYNDFRMLDHSLTRNIANITSVGGGPPLPSWEHENQSLMKAKLEQYFLDALHESPQVAQSDQMKLFLGVKEGWSDYVENMTESALTRDSKSFSRPRQPQPKRSNEQSQTQTGAPGAAGRTASGTFNTSAKPSTPASSLEPDLPSFSRVEFTVDHFRTRPTWILVRWGAVYLFDSQQNLEASAAQGKDFCKNACRKRLDLARIELLGFEKADLTGFDLRFVNIDITWQISLGWNRDMRVNKENSANLDAFARAIVNESISARAGTGGSHEWFSKSNGKEYECRTGTGHAKRGFTPMSDTLLPSALGWRMSDVNGRKICQKASDAKIPS